MNRVACFWAGHRPFMPDDHSKLVPLLPIPNRTVKRLSADDSADSRVKVGHRQALTACKTPNLNRLGVLLYGSATYFAPGSQRQLILDVSMI